MIFIKYPKFEDIDVKYIVDSFMIIVSKYDLNSEEIDIIKNMLGKMAIKFTVE